MKTRYAPLVGSCIALGLLLQPAASQAASTHAPHRAIVQKTQRYKLQGTLTSIGCEDYAIENANVVVRNQDNKVVGATATSSNLTANYAQAPNYDMTCKVQFTVSVPKAAMYQIKIGTHDGPVFSFHQLVVKHWKIALSLGS